MRRKPLLLFLIKAILIYALLAAPFSFYDETYGKFYRKYGDRFFHRFHGNGLTIFSEGEEKFKTHVDVGNYTLVRADTTVDTVLSVVNTRSIGYLPTVLLISLIISSPVSWKRKLMALLLGFVLLTSFIMFQLWILIIHLCAHNKSLNLYDFSKGQKNVIDFTYNGIVVSGGFSWFIVVAIWLLVTIRKDDLMILYKKKL